MNLRVFLAILTALAAAPPAIAQDTASHRLTVSGRVHVAAKADRAMIQFDLRGVGNSLSAAFADARTKLDGLAQRLYAIGLTQGNLSTSFFRNEENFGDKAFLSSKRDYRAVMTVTVTTEKLELLEPIVVAISESAVELIRDISFELVRYSQLRQDAIVKATETAKAKAELVANSLGVRLVDVLGFEEVGPAAVESSRKGLLRSSNANPFNAYMAMDMAEGGGQGGIFSDDMDFDVEVRVVFAIEAAAGKTP